MAKPFPLFQLPLELQDKIVTTSVGNRAIHIESVDSSEYSSLRASTCCDPVNPNHHLKLTCHGSWNSNEHSREAPFPHAFALLKALRTHCPDNSDRYSERYERALSILYRTNIFVVSDGDTFRRFCEKVPHVENIKHLTLVFADRWKRWAWCQALAATKLSRFGRLESLHLVNKIGGAWTQVHFLRSLAPRTQDGLVQMSNQNTEMDLASKLKNFATDWTGNVCPEVFTQKRSRVPWDFFGQFRRFGQLPNLKHVKVTVDDNWVRWLWRNSKDYDPNHRFWPKFEVRHGFTAEQKERWARALLGKIFSPEQAKLARLEERPHLAVEASSMGARFSPDGDICRNQCRVCCPNTWNYLDAVVEDEL